MIFTRYRGIGRQNGSRFRPRHPFSYSDALFSLGTSRPPRERGIPGNLSALLGAEFRGPYLRALAAEGDGMRILPALHATSILDGQKSSKGLALTSMLGAEHNEVRNDLLIRTQDDRSKALRDAEFENCVCTLCAKFC